MNQLSQMKKKKKMDDIEVIEIPDADKAELLQKVLQTWYNTYYVATANARIAQVLGDTQMLEQAKKQMSRALQASAEISKMMDELGVASPEGLNGS